VNAETQQLCLPGEIGEIWVKGPGVASAYWNKTDETEFTFGAVLSDSDEGPFLRTGDLGFLHDGELYVTGRLKNLIISEGKNHYSHDIERTVEASHSAIRPAGCAALSINNSVRERIVIIAEVDHKLNVKAEDVISAIRKAIAVHHDLQVDDIRLTVAGAIPRTTSGKIRHHLCRTNYITGNLKEISLT
jgi:acyl-CoA synthetase (AMP-forming)/AMP-acid ligase II